MSGVSIVPFAVTSGRRRGVVGKRELHGRPRTVQGRGAELLDVRVRAAGANAMTATVSGGPLNGTVVTFTATGTSGTSAQFAIFNWQRQQSATVGASVSTPPVVIDARCEQQSGPGRGGDVRHRQWWWVVLGVWRRKHRNDGEQWAGCCGIVDAWDDSGDQYADCVGVGSAWESADVYRDGHRIHGVDDRCQYVDVPRERSDRHRRQRPSRPRRLCS